MMKTALQEMYDDVMHQKEKSLQYYLDLEREHLISAYKRGNDDGFEGLKYNPEEYYETTYNKRQEAN